MCLQELEEMTYRRHGVWLIRRSLVISIFLLLLVTQSWSAESLYESSGELLSVSIDDSMTISVPETDRQIPLRVVYPDAGGPFPVIILSHGTFSSGKKYDPVATHWAARGYVVVLPDHIDANYGVVPTKNDDMYRVSRSRVADMSILLNRLDEIEGGIPGLEGRMKQQQVIAAGHSFGTQVAMLVTGLRIKNPTNQAITQSDETGFSLLVMLSDPGKMALMPEDTWMGSTVPTFLATGTEDYGLMGDGNRVAEFQNEILSLGDAPDADQYLLLIDKGDHYFGGLIHKTVDTEPDHEGLEIFNTTSTAFLDAYAKNDSDARIYLQSGTLLRDTDGRAALTVE
jgi:hypothetical protein